MLLPPSLEELIEENHPVRLVNDVIDRIKYPFGVGRIAVCFLNSDFCSQKER